MRICRKDSGEVSGKDSGEDSKSNGFVCVIEHFDEQVMNFVFFALL